MSFEEHRKLFLLRSAVVISKGRLLLETLYRNVVVYFQSISVSTTFVQLHYTLIIDYTTSPLFLGIR
jgi:hypothetical protein